MATLSDIAREVGCSPSTVSRALHDSSRISVKTRKRIAEVAHSLNYWGNTAARSLRYGESRKIGLVIPTVQNSYYNQNTYVVHDTLTKEGYQIVLCCHHNDPKRDADILRSLMRHEVDGIIHFPCTLEGAEGVIGPNPTIPVIEIGLQSQTSWADSVCTDESSGVAQLVNHLEALGHERIALISGHKELYHVQVRATAFNGEVAASHLSASDCSIYNGPATVQWARETTFEIFDDPDPPTALIVANSPMMVGTLIALRKKRLAIPKHVSVAGLSNEDWYAASRPTLTAYELPIREMGVVAAQTLLRRLQPDTDSDTEPVNVALYGRLIIRASTARANT